MQPIEYFYLIILIVFCLTFTFLIYGNIYKKGREEDNRYKLFKIRDNLIHLIAKGVIKEDDFIFYTFYDMTNTYIQHIHRFNLKEINKAMKEAKEKNRLYKAKEFAERVMRELENKDEEVKEVTKQFFLTMLDIIVRNSLSVRLIIKLYGYAITKSFINSCRKFLKISRERERAFQNYQLHNGIYESLEKASS